MISKAEFQEWQSHPVTKAFYQALSETRADALERLAHNIPQEHWAINLSMFLQGEAREVYHNLPAGEADDFTQLKKALLLHYKLTADAYRQKFREATKRQGETHPQFHTRMRTLFEKWIAMLEIDRSYEALREEIIKEQVLGTYRKDLVVFLAEREHKSLEEIGTLADR